MTDETHDPATQSWVASAEGHADFPIQNLPFGIFSPGGAAPRAGVAIGDEILDLAALAAAGLIADPQLVAGATLNPLLAAGAAARKTLRRRLHDLLRHGSDDRVKLAAMLHPAADCTLHLPAAIGDYSDFYAGIHHATAVGQMLRPDQPLPPNYKYVPIGYHGRASSIRPSGSGIRRPSGQRKRGDEAEPSYGPCRNLDHELELGVWIGPGNPLGTTIPIAQAAEYIAGFCLLNDWSARDLQGWEYQPLGPFLAKSFATTISPWIVTPEALVPFRAAQPPRPEGDPQPLPYLSDPDDQAEGALDLALEVLLQSAAMRQANLPPHRLSQGTATSLYWTVAQMVTHQASNGCNLRPGDLLGTGTISGPDPGSAGSLLELTRGGRAPFTLPSGETRRFLEDGDEIFLHARARREGAATIGFGVCRGQING